DPVRDRLLDHRDAEEVLLRLLDTLGDRRGHFLGLAVADADGAFTVADHHEGGEAEATTTLHDLGDAVDGNHPLDVLVLVVLGSLATTIVTATTLTAATAGAALLGFTHRVPLPFVDCQNPRPASRAASASAAMRPWYLLPARSKTTSSTPACFARSAISSPTLRALSDL